MESTWLRNAFSILKHAESHIGEGGVVGHNGNAPWRRKCCAHYGLVIGTKKLSRKAA
jgi:hypothetical protein